MNENYKMPFVSSSDTMLLSDNGSRFSILIRQAKPVLSKKSVINPCDEGKLSKAFCEKHKNHVDPPGQNEGIVLSSIYVQRNDRILFQKRE